MVSFTVTATLVTGHETITWNGYPIEIDVDVPISVTITSDTLLSAKRQAREEVNKQALAFFITKVPPAPLVSTLLTKGRTAIQVIQWISLNITDIKINA